MSSYVDDRVFEGDIEREIDLERESEHVQIHEDNQEFDEDKYSDIRAPPKEFLQGTLEDRLIAISDMKYEMEQEKGSVADIMPSRADFRGKKNTPVAYGNTGPKGVRADYEEHKREQNRQNAKDKENRDAILRASSITVNNQEPVVSFDTMNDDALNELELMMVEDPFFDSWKESRIAEMKQANIKAMQQSINPLPIWGSVRMFNSKSFIQNVENPKHPETIMIILLTDPGIPSCDRLNRVFSVLAQRHLKVDFCSLKATEADIGFDKFALPTILVYQDGKQLTNIVKVTLEVGEYFKVDDIENLLVSKGVIRLEELEFD